MAPSCLGNGTYWLWEELASRKQLPLPPAIFSKANSSTVLYASSVLHIPSCTLETLVKKSWVFATFSGNPTVLNTN